MRSKPFASCFERACSAKQLVLQKDNHQSASWQNLAESAYLVQSDEPGAVIRKRAGPPAFAA